jgi:hypothetical protein
MKLRDKKLLDPRLQLKFVAAFACTAGLAAMVQTLVLSRSLAELAAQLPADGPLVRNRTLSILTSSTVWTLLLLVPICIAIGLLMSFRIAGPLHRFRCFLTDLIAGKKPEDCRLRKGDELQDVCELLNAATAPLRTASPGEERTSDAA